MMEETESSAAGQGSLSGVPVLNLPCEKCGMQLELEEKFLPEICPHCGYRVRPATGSMWNNFVFVLRNRYFSWRGRATRKEFWSYTLFSISFVVLAFLLESIITYIGVGLVFLYFFFPHLFLIVRRLHDIGFSGALVKIYWILAFILVIEMAATYLYIETGNAYAHFDKADLVFSHPDSAFIILLQLAALLNFALEIIRLFFLVASFINSNRGTNQYGPSRKYPLGFSA